MKRYLTVEIYHEKARFTQVKFLHKVQGFYENFLLADFFTFIYLRILGKYS